MDNRHQPVSANDIAVALLRRRRLFVLVYAGVLIAALIRTVTVAPQYQAAAKILLTSNQAEISTSPERPTELVRNQRVPPEELNTQREVLRSRELLESVLRKHFRPGDPSAEDATPAFAGLREALARLVERIRSAFPRLHPVGHEEGISPIDRKVAHTLKKLEVTALKQSNIIEVAFTGPDRVGARDFVNDLTAAYIEHHAHLRQVGEAEHFFTSQSELLHQKLAASEEKLREEREKAGALAGERDEILDLVKQLSAELTATTISRAEAEGRVSFLEATRTREPAGAGIATPDLLTLEAKRAELLGRFRPESERVKAVEDQIRILRSAIAGYDVVTAAGGAELADGLLGARAELAALQAKGKALAGELGDYRRLANELHAQSFNIERLERQVRLDEGAYLSYVRAAEESRLSNALEQSNLLRLTIVEAASTPIEPVGPTTARVLMFGLMGGLVVSAVVALARDYLDPTIQTTEDVQRYTGLDVLAVIDERA